MVAVGKALTKAQKSTYNKMIGDKFDVAQLRQGMFARFQAPGAPTTPAATSAAADTTATADASKAPAPAAKEAPKPAARKSLRDARGGSNQP